MTNGYGDGYTYPLSYVPVRRRRGISWRDLGVGAGIVAVLVGGGITGHKIYKHLTETKDAEASILPTIPYGEMLIVKNASFSDGYDPSQGDYEPDASFINLTCTLDPDLDKFGDERDYHLRIKLDEGKLGTLEETQKRFNNHRVMIRRFNGVPGVSPKHVFIKTYTGMDGNEYIVLHEERLFVYPAKDEIISGEVDLREEWRAREAAIQ